jgi:hypothetical protein
LLKETERAAGGQELLDQHLKLVEWGRKEKGFSSVCFIFYSHLFFKTIAKLPQILIL